MNPEKLNSDSQVSDRKSEYTKDRPRSLNVKGNIDRNSRWLEVFRNDQKQHLNPGTVSGQS